MKGSYFLLIENEHDQLITVGNRKKCRFPKGYYVYVGSALSGLEQRIHRHLRKEKKIHWHIDYLLQHTKICRVYYKESDKREECSIARTFENHLTSIPEFGCSDCTCNSHLFYGSKNDIKDIARSLEMTKANA